MYKRIEPRKLTGREKFKNTGGKDFSVLELWQYGFSSLNSNVLRGAVAEFLVEKAIENEIKVRNPWGDFDVVTDKGVKIEVKSGSFLQDWDQMDYSKIVFSGLKAKGLYWNAAVAEYKPSEADYKADIYVLSVFNHKDPETLDILDLDQWHFYVLSREEIRKISNDGSSLSLAKLEKLNFKPVGFSQLKSKIDSLQDEK